MIVARIRIGNDRDYFDGDCELPALPPIGGHIRIVDRNGNMQHLRVSDVVVQGVSSKMRRQLPATHEHLWIEVICTETFADGSD